MRRATPKPRPGTRGAVRRRTLTPPAAAGPHLKACPRRLAFHLVAGGIQPPASMPTMGNGPGARRLAALQLPFGAKAAALR